MRHTPDMYIPVFAILEFICYMGWIKVAETLLNPWGDDDEVIEQIYYSIQGYLFILYTIKLPIRIFINNMKYISGFSNKLFD